MSSESEKLQAQMKKLNSEYDLAKNKTKTTADALNSVKKVTGENSEETRIWTNKLSDAQKNEEFLKNKIEGTNVKLKAATQAESEAAKASDNRKNKLKELSTEQDHLKASSDKLSKEYDLQVAKLGNNAKATDKAKLSKQYFANQEKATAAQVKNLEERLEIAKREYGENSTEVDKLSNELLDAKKSHQEFANSLSDSNNKLLNFGNSMTKSGEKLKSIGKGMTVGVTAPIVAGVAASVKAASEFDSAFTGVKKTVDEAKDANGKTTISYKDLEGSIRQMAKTIPATTTEISHVAESAGQLGIKTESVMSFTRTMIDMGQATNMSSEDASVALAKLANITGMPQKNFDRLGSSIVNLGNNMATTESDIVNMSLRLAGTGHQVGLTESQITGLAAAMSSVGINAEAGGGAMSRVMQKMNTSVLSGGETLDKFAQVSGMSSSQFQKAWKDDASQAIVSFVKGLGKAKKSGKDVSSMLKDMGINSTQEIDTMLRLSGAGGTLSKALDISAKGWKDNTALTNEAQKRYETFSSKLQIMKNKVSDLGIEFGGPLMDALSSVLDALNPVFKVVAKMAKSFSEASPATQKFVVVLLAMAAAIGPIIGIIGSLMTVFGPLVTAIGASGIAIVAVPLAIMAAVAAIGIAVAYIVTHWEETKKKTEEIWKAIVDFLSDTWDSIIQGAQDIFSSIGAFFANLWNGIKDKTSEIWTAITDWISNTWQKIVDVASTIWNGLTSVFTVIFMTIQSIIQGVWLFIASWLQFTWNAIVALTEPIWRPIADFFTNLWNGISNVAQTVWTAISTWFSNTWNTIVNVAKTIWNAFASFMSGLWDGIKSVAMSVWNTIKSVLNGTWNGIKSDAMSVFDAIKNVVTNVWNGIKNVSSSVWNGIKSVISGVWNGIKSQVSSAANAVRNTVSDIWNGIKNTTSNIWNGIKNAMVTPINTAKDAISRAVNAIKGFFAGMHLRIPKISMPALPHFSLNGHFSLKPPSVPHLSVNWYAKGGVFNKPTLFPASGGANGLGEAGPEAALPLTKSVLGTIGDAIFKSANIEPSAITDSRSTNTFNITFNNEIASDYDVNAMFEKTDQWLADKGARNNYGVRGNA